MMEWFIGYALVGIVIWVGMAIEDFPELELREGLSWAVFLVFIMGVAMMIAWAFVVYDIYRQGCPYRDAIYTRKMRARRQSDFELYGC